ncbi:MAG: hypothetical protein HXY35_10970 [Chloroflexi bacterium]|nr:hypothetical protein [Chloroflexota bacterium]
MSKNENNNYWRRQHGWMHRCASRGADVVAASDNADAQVGEAQIVTDGGYGVCQW